MADQVDKTLSTPYVPLDSSGAGEVTLLGLAPLTSYAPRVEAYSAGSQLATQTVAFGSGALPTDLASITMQLSGTPRVGYYLVSGLSNSAFAVDETGAIRWYHELGATTEETKLQTDGTFTSTVGTSEGWQPVPCSYVRYTPAGTPIATYTPTTPDPTESNAAVYGDVHEFLVTKDDAGQEHMHFIAYELRPKSDQDPTLAAWHELVRQAPDGTVEFQWKTWPRFTAADVTETIPVAGAEDTDHANALVLDPTDGNYVMSFRDLDAVIKIDYATGAVLWQLGGRQNGFTIDGDPLNGFYGQHSVRVLANGNLLLYDNGLGHVPPESRAVEYHLDTTAKTATMVWEYRHAPAIFTPIVGSVERYADGNTLVAFADAGTVDEVDASATLVWEGQLKEADMNAPAYRVRFLPSLYAYLAP